MTSQLARIEISTMPDLARLADEVARTRRPCLLQRGDDEVALTVPAGTRTTRSDRQAIVDLSDLPPVPHMTIDELIADRPARPTRQFTDEEIADALDEDLAERWRAKFS